MDFSTDSEGEVKVINIPERLTSDTSDSLKKLLKELVDDGHYKIVMDLDKTNYMDSSGLGAIVSKIAVTRSKNGDIHLANPKKYVINLLELTHIDQIIKIYNNRNEAINSFGNE